MSLPKPQAGLVIRYSYLWHRERDAGLLEGVKARPCAIVVAVERSGGAMLVRVLPITHSAPSDPKGALEIPHATKRRLGLDEMRSWIILDEANEFMWPGPDLVLARKGELSSAVFGLLPPAFIAVLRDKFKARYLEAKSKSVRRGG